MRSPKGPPSLKPRPRTNLLGSLPQWRRAEYIYTRQGFGNGELKDFIKLDAGEGQDFESLNYYHRLRQKLRRAFNNAKIRKEMLVRQRALDYCNDKNMEIPEELKTPYKPTNPKGQRILDNSTFETAKQERVYARMELAEFSTQMRVLRRQAEEAAICAGLRKHAELLGKIPPSDPPIKQKEADDAKQNGERADIVSAPKQSLTPAALKVARAGMERSCTESEGSKPMDNGDQSQQDSRVAFTSDDDSNIESPTSTNDMRASKRRKKQMSQPDLKVSDMQSRSTNSDRQAMIDAELALSANKKRKHGQLPCQSRFLNKVDTNVERAGTDANSWNLDRLPGNMSRESEFLRLLGGQKSAMGGNGAWVSFSASSTKYSRQVNADLRGQHKSSLAYKEESKRKGLGSGSGPGS